ncbi:MAG: BrnT family toxin [Betaproteobacteria bacterium]|uniref:BrnT family toxin n=1 Tax=Thiomonas sp. FB-6 TaxID=1158291 RepID=UPI000360595F|nr:BrnT family toxin [Thiomonas sp. FB-6]MBU6441748.1 BrnT family toxin [Betaproteobacteria bacterium]MBU6511107.1 BrnT family toxin [Betaproteobacteria bacterium]MDE1957053.1 BrnT family toxin [Betaproteobacteria bacterium]MDE2151435.1 BrnT family toxin [Betaproteobacteria bacterium]MDE2479188.1 BrnT family toxin [Betaproteobacteria bacterium]
MRIEFDECKRAMTLAGRGLDFAHAGRIFEGPHFTAEDRREDYGEPRFITAGMLDDRLVVLVWTPRGSARRVISLRRANEREQARFQANLHRSG